MFYIITESIFVFPTKKFAIRIYLKENTLPFTFVFFKRKILIIL